MKEFLPISKKDMKKRGWDAVDFVYINGDAYVDHPSFGAAIITRVLEAHGYRIGFIAQPDWKNEESIQVFGRPQLGFLVSAGNMDSMVNHYTVSKKRRGQDAYSPGGVTGKRPDYATVVYCNLIRKVYKKVPIIIGGIEASLRRLAHYDYWSDSMKHSILMDSQADLLIYGMGEHSVVEIADALASGIGISDLTFIRGTVFARKVWTWFMIILNCHLIKGSVRIKRNMQKAFIPSIAIRTLLRQNVLRSLMGNRDILCRIHRQSL